jgi:hypothetical protein
MGSRRVVWRVGWNWRRPAGRACRITVRGIHDRIALIRFHRLRTDVVVGVRCGCDGIGATDSERLPSILVEVATRVVIAQHPRLPNAQVRKLEVRIALFERRAEADCPLGRQTWIAFAQRILPGGADVREVDLTRRSWRGS